MALQVGIMRKFPPRTTGLGTWNSKFAYRHNHLRIHSHSPLDELSSKEVSDRTQQKMDVDQRVVINPKTNPLSSRTQQLKYIRIRTRPVHNRLLPRVFDSHLAFVHQSACGRGSRSKHSVMSSSKLSMSWYFIATIFFLIFSRCIGFLITSL